MAKVLSSIFMDAPASPVDAAVNDTFAFTGTPGVTGSGGQQRFDFKWEVDSGGGFVTIAAAGTGLITADTNPIINTNSAAQKSITVTCDEAGSYTIRMAGAPTSGGSYTVLSATQTVEVAAAANVTVTPGVIALVLATFAAVVTATANITVTPTTKALSLTTFAPAVTVTQNQTVTPTTKALSLTTFAPTVSIGGSQTVTPTTATLTTAVFAPTVTASDHKTVTPTTVALTLATFAPTVTETQNQTVTPTTAVLSLTTFAPTVIGDADVLNEILSILKNKRILDPTTGIFTIYDTDGTTPIYSAQTYKDVAGTQPFDGTGRIIRTEELI
jgi:hypothetical protein